MKNVMLVLLFIGTWIACGTSVAAEAAADGSSVVMEGDATSPDIIMAKQEAAEAKAAARLEAVEACVVCHGVDGNSAANVEYPKLAAQHIAVLKKQLIDFTNGRRVDPAGECLAKTLNARDDRDKIQNIAEYFAMQERTAETNKFDSKLIKKGKDLYQKDGTGSCRACHGDRAQGNYGFMITIPYLRAQHKEHMVNQIKAFRDGRRSNDWENMMSMAVADMADDEIEAVAAYLASLEPNLGLGANAAKPESIKSR